MPQSRQLFPNRLGPDHSKWLNALRRRGGYKILPPVVAGGTRVFRTLTTNPASGAMRTRAPASETQQRCSLEYPERKPAPAAGDTLQLITFDHRLFSIFVPLATALEFKNQRRLQSGVLLEEARRGKYGQQASSICCVSCGKSDRCYFCGSGAKREGLRESADRSAKRRDDNAHAIDIRSYLSRWLVELPEARVRAGALPHHGRQRLRYVARYEIARGCWRTGSASCQAQSLSISSVNSPGCLWSSGMFTSPGGNRPVAPLTFSAA